MTPTRRLPAYALLVPALIIAAGVLGYYTYLTASRFARLNEEAIAASTLLLAREKVDTIERYIIDQDNALFSRIPSEAPETIESFWRPIASEITPSVRAVIVLDEEQRLLAYDLRADETERESFMRRFRTDLVRRLELDELPVDRLGHRHLTIGERNYLFSVRRMSSSLGELYYVAHHDTGYMVREVFPDLFATEEGRRQYNVVDVAGRTIYGRSLAEAGDYLVGHRFPTTLYEWRLQIAPQQATQLETQSRSRNVVQLGSLGLSFAVIVLGIVFLFYAASKERRLNQLKSEFIANVSHELKTPLSVVRMFGEMLLTKRVRTEEKQRQYLEIIVRESERLSALIENVLDFSALERGKQKYRFEPRAIDEVVAQAVETFRYRLDEEGVDVVLNTDEDLPDVALDEQAIVLAVVNLLDNAVKYGGGTPVEVSVTRSGSRTVHVRVRDHGPGIPEEAQRRVFERFFRMRATNEVRGSGIGLALVKHIAEAHGGRSWATNAADGGAVVAFTLPAARREADEENASG